MTDKEAMKLALFALDIVKIHYTQSRHINEAITALKERLAQETALQALHNENERLGLYKDAYSQPEQEQQIKTLKRRLFEMQEAAKDLAERVRPLTPPQRTEQEPDVIMHWESHTWTTNNPPPNGSGDVGLYYAPPQRPWVGLTVDELITLEQKHMRHEDLSRAIASKLKEKNNG